MNGKKREVSIDGSGTKTVVMSEDLNAMRAESRKKNKELKKITDALRTMTAALPEIAEYRKAAFDEHVKAGFTEAQALELCAKLT